MANHRNDADDVSGQFIGNNPIEQFLSKCGQNCGCPVTVRYECGGCCLKATNCRLAGIVNDFLGLRAFSAPGIITDPCECEECNGSNDLIGLSVDGAGRPPWNGPCPPPVTLAQCALIPLAKVCSIESGAMMPMGGGSNSASTAQSDD